MTLGFYINAPYALVVSDCLATPNQKTGQPKTHLYSPSNIEKYDGKNGDLADLVSKFIKLDSNTIVTFSGTYGHIENAAHELSLAWEDRDRSMRPMEFLREKDLAMKEHGWDCGVLGCSILPSLDKSGRNQSNTYASVEKHWNIETNHYGKCCGIGTGAAEIRSFIENSDAQITQLQQKNPSFPQTDNFLLWKLLGALNGKTLFSQGEALEEQTWGGILQAQIYSPEHEGWYRTPTWLHISLIYKGSELEFVGLHNKSVIHTSKIDDDNTGAVITKVQDARGGTTRIWPIFSPFANRDATQALTFSDLRGIPDYVTISVRIRMEKKTHIMQRTYHFDDVKGIVDNSGTDCLKIDYDVQALQQWLRAEMIDEGIPQILAGL